MIATVGGADLAYDDVGQGMPVVFLHAFPLDRRMWAAQTNALAGRARCIAPDLRGFGESTVAPPYSMTRYADDVAGLLDALGIDRAVIVGLSIGGYIAFELWRRHRDRFRALVLADTRAGADTPQALERRRAVAELARTQGAGAVAAQQISSSLGKTTRERRPDVRDAVYDIMASAPVDGIVGALEAMMARPDSAATLPTIDVPTLIVVGDEDAVTRVPDAREMQAAIPGSRLEIVAQAGHLSNLEQPAAFNASVSEFLGTLHAS